MRRFFIFPPLFAVWFLAAQFGLMVVNYFGTSLWLRLTPPVTDIYYHTLPLSRFLAPLLLAFEVGAVVGVFFAAFALVFRRSRGDKKMALSLVSHLVKSGVVAVGLILFFQGAMLYVTAQSSHRRYHAYPPDMQWLNLISCAQILVLLASVLWAMGRTLFSREHEGDGKG